MRLRRSAHCRRRLRPGVPMRRGAATHAAATTDGAGAPFNNLFTDCVQGANGVPAIDFAAHARSLGALGENVKTIAELEAALVRARNGDRTSVVCIETDPNRTTTDGGAWWEVAVPEV